MGNIYENLFAHTVAVMRLHLSTTKIKKKQSIAHIILKSFLQRINFFKIIIYAL